MAQGSNAVVANPADVTKAAAQKAADDAAKVTLGQNKPLARAADPTIGGENFGYGH